MHVFTNPVPKKFLLQLTSFCLASSVSLLAHGQITCEKLLNGATAATTSPIEKQFAAKPLAAPGTVTTGQHEFGPILYYKANASDVGPMRKDIRIGEYNIENLFEHIPADDHSYTPERENTRRLGNARAIREINPDFQIVIEVEDIQILRKFNDQYLNGLYEPFLIDGNDERGIDIGILVKRDLPINFEWRSYKEVKDPAGNKVFSRDLPVGLVFERDANGVSLAKPKFAIMGTHFKSKRVEPGQPDHTPERRHEQALAAIEIAKRIRKEFGADLPIILAGDFNNAVHNSPEFAVFFAGEGQGTGNATPIFKDTLDMVPVPVQGAARATQYYFPKDGAPVADQLDAILLLSDTVKVLSATVIPNRDAAGNILPAPKTFKEREQTMPSDHRPTGIVINIP